MKWAVWFALPPVGLSLMGQSLTVYSEFVRFNAAVEVTAPSEPREILSPALVRNGFTSFQIAVRVEPETPYWLVAGENPNDAVKLTVYVESGDRLERVQLPYSGSGPQIFWMDLWTDRNAPVRRIKVEPQIYVHQDWFTYPMEARVMEATVPSDRGGETLCGVGSSEAGDVARLRFRNAQQDAALAGRAPKQELSKLAAGCESKSAADAEFYLRIRDYLFRMR